MTADPSDIVELLRKHGPGDLRDMTVLIELDEDEAKRLLRMFRRMDEIGGVTLRYESQCLFTPTEWWSQRGIAGDLDRQFYDCSRLIEALAEACSEDYK